MIAYKSFTNYETINLSNFMLHL